MKKLAWLLLCVVAVFLMVGLTGCETVTAWSNGEQIISDAEYQVLPADQQVAYDSVTVKQIDPGIASKIDSGVNATNAGYAVVKPFIPEPFATLGVLLVGGATTIWQSLKKKKIQSRLDAVELGAAITAQTVNEVVKPSVEVWQQFKEKQRSASSNTKAIMPDRVLEKPVT